MTPEVHSQVREEVSKQVQSAVEPLARICNQLNQKLEKLEKKADAIDADNKSILLALNGDENNDGIVKQVRKATELIVGGRAITALGKTILMVGAIVGMFWGVFMAITHSDAESAKGTQNFITKFFA